MQRIIILLACLFLETVSTAQLSDLRKRSESHGQYPFVHYTPKDGLINSRVRKAWQDSKGRMYFLTYGGLSVYDGARFRNYTTQDGLYSNFINDILEITPDSFIVATNTHGLNALVNGKVRKLELTGNNPATMNQFVRDEAGRIYATSDQGLFRLEGNKVIRCAAQLSPSLQYLGIMANSGDHLLFYTNDLLQDKLIYLYNKKTDRLDDTLSISPYINLQPGPGGSVWACLENGLHTVDPTAIKRGKLVLVKYDLKNEAAGFLPVSLLFNQQQEMIVFDASSAIVICRKDGSQLYIPSPGLALEVLQSAFLDREGVLWMCYDGNGIYKLSNTRLQSKDHFLNENTKDILTVTPFSNDSTWFEMTNNRWILQHRDQKKIFTNHPSIDARPLRATQTHIYGVAPRTLYMAPFTPGTDVLNFQVIMELPDTSSFGLRSAIDPAGNLILHDRTGIRVMKEGEFIASFHIDYFDLVEGIYLSRKQQLWLVTRNTGIHVLSINPNDPSRYFKEEKIFLQELEKSSPRCMVVDNDEKLWIGTRQDGILCFDMSGGTAKKVQHFTQSNGLTDNFVISLACDGNNNIIAGTQTGLDRILHTTSGYRVDNITKSSNIFNFVQIVWTDAHDNAYGFTNTKTVLQVVAPNNMIPAPAPQLLIENIRVNGEPLTDINSGIRLAHYQRNIIFSLAAPTFIDEKQVQFSYRLRGSGNNEWSEAGTNADISLINLAPGDYVLEVRANFPSTSYSSKEIAFAFEIRPPWWQTWWFRIALAVLIVAAVMYVIRFYYRRKLEKEKAVLERKQAIEKERTRIATDMHDDLGAGLSRIKFLSETIGLKKQMQQPIEEDINSIRQYSHEMIDKMGEIVWALNEKNDSLSDLLSYTRSYAATYLSQNGIHCTIEAPDQFSAIEVSGEYRRNIYLAVKEALHNVVKHSQATEVLIHISTGDQLTITIHDNGTGFSSAAIRPYSNGLSNMQKRMADIGGRLEILSTEGTTVTLEAPLS